MESAQALNANDKNACVLVIDDSSDSRLLLVSILRLGGYHEVLTAGSAPEACQYFTADAAGQIKTRVDLILMDFNMPEMNGVEACRQFKTMEGLQDIPILMVTGSSDTDSLPLAFAAGAMDYIHKPVNKIELLARIRSAVMLKQELDHRKARERELEKALNEIKVLRGIMPICASCKKIRNDEGYWTQIETYIAQHSEAVFSHGMCPRCVKDHYPELYPALLKQQPHLFAQESSPPDRRPADPDVPST